MTLAARLMVSAIWCLMWGTKDGGKDSNKYINKSNICHAYVTENDKIFLIKQDKRRN